MPNLDIITDSKKSIQHSFDRIATDLIHNWHLKVNDTLYSFTEIEFYFFMTDIHQDTASREHNYDKGFWRFHQKGLDITFQSQDNSDGGILIRGLKTHTEYINGPVLVLEHIFRKMDSIIMLNKEFGLVLKPEPSDELIYKTQRHGLPNNPENEFKEELYRYFINLEHWNKRHINPLEKARIKKNSVLVGNS
ncbi:hypothetical protein QNI19_29470 [Cytophagaceae bacterium DM2B3-1]|uniref:Uncharacterized protein n=1 Tax=Xanthocytophaga flava TaxID=3048013 RepID=A0ABT7CTN1_9BACT|nr:hypothetical protein [Xanthocytophaga flavus]MDJ1467978.1 hypothetical protein [Xanthocytophaga flavus]MDJ1497104.1 hypothetical protein [Xanthocytophaga flavus]